MQFMFLEDTTLKTEGLQMMDEDELGDMAELSGFPSERTEALPDISDRVGDNSLSVR